MTRITVIVIMQRNTGSVMLTVPNQVVQLLEVALGRLLGLS